MASDNSDSDDSLNVFQLTDNIKTEENSQRSPAPSTSSSEESNTSIIQIKKEENSQRSSAASTSSSEENNTSIIQSAAKKVSRNSDSTLTDNIKKKKNSQIKRSPVSSTSSLEENNTSIIQSPAEKVSLNSDSKLPLNLEHYLSKYKGQFIPQTGVAKALDEIESDEEVFIVQASKDFNLKEFVGNKLDIKKTNNLETSDGLTLEYYVQNYTKKPNLTLICGEKSNSAMKVNTINPSGKIIIREKLFTDETGGLGALDVKLPKKVPFPRDLKIRHPLFGAFYEDKINLSNKIIKQLQSPRKTKKIKIKTEHSIERPIKMKQFDFEESAEETPTKKHKKSKKMKLEQEVTVASDMVDNIIESITGESPKKKKKVKVEKFDDDNDLSWLTNI